jgi:glycosyltransferase involved in cell wall biosynthesis
MLTVIHVVESFDGGVISFLKELVKINHVKHVIVYGSRSSIIFADHFDSDKVLGIQWKEIGREINIVNDVKGYINLSNILSGLKFNILHLHSSKAGFLGRLWAMFNKFHSVIYTPHGVSFNRIDISQINQIKFKVLELLASKFSGEIICVSKSEASSYGLIGLKPKWISNGISYEANEKFAQTTLKDKFRVVTIGRLCEQKDPQFFDLICQNADREKYEFVWIGGGNEVNREDFSFTITGWLSQEKVLDILYSSDIYISTAQWEGLPLAVLEAMSCSLPLLLRNCVGNIDLVGQGVNGYLFNHLNEALSFLELLSNPSTIESFGKKSFEKLSKDFSAEGMRQEYLKVYKNTFQKSRKT